MEIPGRRVLAHGPVWPVPPSAAHPHPGTADLEGRAILTSSSLLWDDPSISPVLFIACASQQAHQLTWIQPHRIWAELPCSLFVLGWAGLSVLVGTPGCSHKDRSIRHPALASSVSSPGWVIGIAASTRLRISAPRGSLLFSRCFFSQMLFCREETGTN